MGARFAHTASRCILDNVDKRLKDVLGIVGFVAAIFIGAFVINTFLFRSFDVKGSSMQETLHTGDRVIVNRLHYTKSVITRQPYLPHRGEIIVFRNPLTGQDGHEDFLVKRVIAFAGERVVVKDGTLSVYTTDNQRIYPDQQTSGPQSPSSGDIDTVVGQNQLFVAGDNRINGHSLDSRNGLGTIPLDNVQGPVVMRVYPFSQARFF